MITVASCGAHTLKVKRDNGNRYSGVSSAESVDYTIMTTGMPWRSWACIPLKGAVIVTGSSPMENHWGTGPSPWSQPNLESKKRQDCQTCWCRKKCCNMGQKCQSTLVQTRVSEDVESSPHWYPKYHSCFSWRFQTQTGQLPHKHTRPTQTPIIDISMHHHIKLPSLNDTCFRECQI